MSAPQKIIELVEDFNENKHEYTNPDIFDEENTKVKFLNPFFEELGWNVRNEGLSARFREVVFEDSIKVGSKTKAPDYSFRLGGERIFFVEAKKPNQDIATNKEHAFQVRRYGWSAKLPLCILTDFEEFAIYDTTIKPDKNQNASIGRIKYYKYTDYVDKWDEIYNIFSKEAVLSGKFDNYANNVKHDKKGTSEVDDEFLKEIEHWRLLLARNIALRNTELSIEDLNYAVQLTIDRIIFLRIAEDRGIERYGQLEKLLQKENIYTEFAKICKKADEKYNSGLFHFNPYDKEDFTSDTYTLDLTIDDSVFKEIFKNLYYPNSPYEFSLISTEILGKIYEQFLGQVIRLTPGHQAKVEEKPEVKKAGGVYYTPQYIVDYIVENTLGEKIKDKTPNQISKLKIIDPACGSGSFLIRAYQYLLDYHLDYYSNLEKPPKDVIYEDKKGEKHLTIREKKRILKNNIYGVDLDTLAVEVTKLSLLLKVLEDQNKDLLESQQKLFHERVLPNLSSNIKNGNSLIGSDILEQQELSMEEIKEIKPFDWEEEYPEIFADNGFDVVIGNPPYVLIQPKEYPKHIIKYYKEKFEVSQYKIDLYHIFFERGIKILKEKGYFGFITPSTYLLNTYLSKLRKFILDNCKIKKIINTENDVFGAKVDTAIIILNKESNTKSRNRNLVEIYKKNNQMFKHEENKDIKQIKYLDMNNYLFNINITSKDRYLLEKINKHGNLERIARVSFGLQTKNKKKYVKEYPVNEQWKPCIDGKNIFPYHLTFSSQYFLHDRRIKAGGCWDEETHNTNIKIVIRQIGEYPIATIDTNRYYCLNTIYNISSLDKKYNYNYVLAILNSNLIKYFWKCNYYDSKILFPKIKKAYLDKIPIPEITIQSQQQLIDLVEKRINFEKKMQASNTPNERKILQQQINLSDKKINELVYELYDLTEEEIKIIEENI